MFYLISTERHIYSNDFQRQKCEFQIKKIAHSLTHMLRRRGMADAPRRGGGGDECRSLRGGSGEECYTPRRDQKQVKSKSSKSNSQVHLFKILSLCFYIERVISKNDI